MTDKTEKQVAQEQEPMQDRRDAMKKMGKCQNGRQSLPHK